MLFFGGFRKPKREPPGYMVAEIVIIIVLVLINGLLSMTETAIIQSRKAKLDALAKKGNHGAALALDLHREPTRFLSTVQIGITAVSILTGIFSGGQIKSALSEWLSRFDFISGYADKLALGTVVVGITFVSLVFGELVPKRLGMVKSEHIAATTSPTMTLLAKITSPFIWLLSTTTNMLLRPFGIQPTDVNLLTEEELRAVIDESTTHGAIDEIEGEIMDRVMLLGDKRINTLMTSRHDIAWLDTDEPLEVNLAKVIALRHSYFPLCKGSLDEVIGIISVKDLFSKQASKQKIDLYELARKPIYFPETMRGYQMLERFQKERTHLALVTDEYGTVVGLVTLTDVFDALVGDMKQEDGQSIGYEMHNREDGSILIDGQYPWIDFLQEIKENDESHLLDGYHTVAGFIIHALEDIPEVGQKVNWKQYTFEVVDMDGPRVDKVLVAHSTS